MSMITFVLFFASSEHARALRLRPKCTQQKLETTRVALGYDEPISTQWGKFAKGVVVGRDFPDDPKLKETATRADRRVPGAVPGLLAGLQHPGPRQDPDALPISISLAIVAFILWMVGGVFFGVIAALRKGTIIDRGIVGLSLIVFAFPTFFIGLLLSSSWRSGGAGSTSRPTRPITEGPWAWFSGLLLPGVHPGAVLHGRLHPDDARLRAGDDDRGLHPHRAGQGPAQARRDRQAHAARGADAARDDVRARLRRPARRRDHHRVGLQLQRRRAASRSARSSASTCRSSSGSCCWWQRS